MKKEITFVLTSCGRTDLLDKTLESFLNITLTNVEIYFLLRTL